MIIAAGSVLVIAAVLTIIWTMQRRLIYFPTSDVPAPSAIGLTDVEEVTFATIDTVVTSPQFGFPTVANPMRTLQMGVRLRF